MVIAISAKKQHGKDTVANIIQEYTNKKFKVVKFADKLKDFVCDLINCTREDLENEDFKNTLLGSEWDYLDDNYIKKQMTPRLLLQKIGTDALRNNVHENIWINATFSNYYDKCNWLITDLRFENEFISLKKYNAITIRINRPSILKNDNHPSETGLDLNKDFDYYITNDSDLDSLKNKVINILKEINFN
jgi:hypothetical protein